MRFQKRNVSLNYLQNYMKKLEPLINAKKKDRQLIIKNRSMINLVCQGVYNILHGTVSINKETKQRGLVGAIVTGLISAIPALISAFS